MLVLVSLFPSYLFSIFNQLEIGNWRLAMLNAVAVVHWLLALFKRHVSFLPGRLAAFVTTSPRRLAHKVNRAHTVYLHIENRLNRRLDLRLGSPLINAEGQ